MPSYSRRNTRRSAVPTTRSSKRSLVKKIRGLTRNMKRREKDEFTKLTFHHFRANPNMSWAPGYVTSSSGTNPGYGATACVRADDAYFDLFQNDPTFQAVLADYENYAVSRVRATYIPHAPATGQRNEHGGIFAMGYDARGPYQVSAAAYYNLNTIGRLKYSKVVPMRGQPVSMAFSIRRLCKDLSTPFWLKAGTSPGYYPNDLGYICLHYFKSGANASATEGNNYFAGYLRTSFTVYFKNRLTRA